MEEKNRNADWTPTENSAAAASSEGDELRLITQEVREIPVPAQGASTVLPSSAAQSEFGIASQDEILDFYHEIDDALKKLEEEYKEGFLFFSNNKNLFLICDKGKPFLASSPALSFQNAQGALPKEMKWYLPNTHQATLLRQALEESPELKAYTGSVLGLWLRYANKENKKMDPFFRPVREPTERERVASESGVWASCVSRVEGALRMLFYRHHWIPSSLDMETQGKLSALFAMMPGINVVPDEKSGEPKLQYRDVAMRTFRRFLSEETERFRRKQAAQEARVEAAADGKSLQKAIDSLLLADKRRAEIQPQVLETLQNPGEGIVELWDRIHSGKKAFYSDSLPSRETLYARDPRADVDPYRIISIDFGTRSTVVAQLDSNGQPSPLRVGTGNWKQDATDSQYENPTVIQFRNIENFRRDYGRFSGRPETRWEDVNVSYEAFQARASLNQYGPRYSPTFFGELKQWASDSRLTVRIRDRIAVDNNGKDITLPAYEKLQDDADVDPIEYYAYYLGLYINSLSLKRISLHYLLTFPVKFTADTKARILRSFRRGLLKSLPQSLVEDEKYSGEAAFTVEEAQVEEPAAYAACALREFRLLPKEGEQIAYAVFDFGGGTSDFDFGLWHLERKERRLGRKKYELERFYNGGDNTLGGENLLMQLAHMVFWDNEAALREKEIQFQRPVWIPARPGYEALESDTLEAQTNTRTLMEILRQVWEIREVKQEGVRGGPVLLREQDPVYEPIRRGVVPAGPATRTQQEPVYEPIQEQAQYRIRNGKIETVPFYTINGEEIKFEDLKVDELKLRSFLKKRLSEAVDAFFSMLYRFTDALPGADENAALRTTQVAVLLAGNAGRSVLLHRIMRQKIDEANHRRTGGGSRNGMFHLYYPLGSPQAMESPENGNDSEARRNIVTGKTGVALGALYTRQGGNIKIIDHIHARGMETPFQFLCGYYDEAEGLLYSCLDKDRRPGEWVEYTEADTPRTELAYASLYAMLGGGDDSDGGVRVRNVELVHLRIPAQAVSGENVILLRYTDPYTVEWAVSASLKEAKKGLYLHGPEKITLKKGN